MTQKLLAALLLATFAAPAFAQDADLAKEGEKVFRRCKACHQLGTDAKNAVGPSLEGVIGRTAGTHEEFSYSKAMTEAGEGGLVWNDDTIFQFLEKPSAMVKGTKMAFPGLKSEDDRHAVIAYIEANGGSE